MFSWHSFHIYLRNNLSANYFIKTALIDITTELEKSDKVEKFFFIRYYDPGFHIRLRVLLREPSEKNTVINLLHKELLDNNDIVMQENESFKEVEYEQEIVRYGGIEGIKLAESQFYLSSELILKLLLQSSDHSYDVMLGYALKIQFAFILGLNLSYSEVQCLLNDICNSWYESARRYVSENLNGKQEIDPFALFELTFKRQKKSLINAISSFHTEIVSPTIKHEIWRDWIDGNREIYTTLCRVLNTTSFTSSSISFKYIVYSYIHMTNNRLGILNRDEAFISYVLKQILTDQLFFNQTYNYV